jgi:hypothetical protein
VTARRRRNTAYSIQNIEAGGGTGLGRFCFRSDAEVGGAGVGGAGVVTLGFSVVTGFGAAVFISVGTGVAVGTIVGAGVTLGVLVGVETGVAVGATVSAADLAEEIRTRKLGVYVAAELTLERGLDDAVAASAAAGPPVMTTVDRMKMNPEIWPIGDRNICRTPSPARGNWGPSIVRTRPLGSKSAMVPPAV